MFSMFSAYIKTITALTIFAAMASMFLPNTSFRKYLELILGVLVLSAVLHPLFHLFQIEETSIYDWSSEIVVTDTLLEEAEYEIIEKERNERLSIDFSEY